MTKEELVGAAYLKISGGYPTMDLSTWWEDVNFLLPAAINYVVSGDYFIGKRDEGEEKIIQPLFLQTLPPVAISVDTVTKQKYFLLPKQPLALFRSRAIDFVGDRDGNEFVPSEVNSIQKYIKGFKKCVTSYRLEGLKGYLYNVPPMLENVVIKMIVNANSLADDEEILLPDGGEITVINMIVDFFIGQRQLPKDYFNTGKEPNLTSN